jgi:three-Cys-motif partner protein
MTMRYDEVGYWSEVKLDIVREYAAAYSQILTARRIHHAYVDAFAGPGVHLSRRLGEFIPGSPLNALNVKPPFDAYHFIDIDGTRIAALRDLVGDRADVSIYHGDCNRILLDEIYPLVRYEDYRRALVLLDPYGLQLDWAVVHDAGTLGTIDLFLNFPSMDMNRNVLWRNPDLVPQEQVERMTQFWGDASWRQAAYDTQSNLFGLEMKPENANQVVVDAFRSRLKERAGFQNVPEAIPMRNSLGAIVYYLVFASQRPVAANIVTDIFNKYRTRGSGGA